MEAEENATKMLKTYHAKLKDFFLSSEINLQLKPSKGITDLPLFYTVLCRRDLMCIYNPLKMTHLRFAQIHLKPYRGYMPLLGNSSPFVREQPPDPCLNLPENKLQSDA